MHGRQERVVYHNECADLTRSLDDIGDVHHSQQRIARRLHPHHAGPACERLTRATEIRLIQKLQLEPLFLSEAREQSVSPTVAVMGCQNDIIRASTSSRAS